MKTSQILASLFFGSLAAAAPINQRDLVTKTEMVMETVVVYTTVWDDEPVAEATTTPAAFFEQPASAVVEAKPTTTATPTPAAVQTPVSVYTPPVQTPSPKVEAPKPVVSAAPKPETTAAPAPKPVTSAAPAPEPETTEAPAPAPAPTTEAAPAPAPTTEAAPAPAPAAPSTVPEKAPSAPSYGSPSGGDFSGDITIYQTMGGFGACGTQLNDSDMIVALAQPAWGASTYDVMTGEASNPWCGQKVQVHYKGNTIEAKVMDMCPGCTGHDIDLSPAAWKALTGSDEMTRYQATWSKIS